MAEKSGSSTSNQSTMAAFAILEEMARHGEAARGADLSHALGMPRARIYR